MIREKIRSYEDLNPRPSYSIPLLQTTTPCALLSRVNDFQFNYMYSVKRPGITPNLDKNE